MKNKEIIKESLLFPIKNYKYFIIVTILFLISEFTQEYFLHSKNSDITTNIIFIVACLIIPLIVLGISLQIIFHLLNKKKGAPKITFDESIKEALQDTILESYYFILALIISTILSIPTGLFQRIDEIPTFMSDMIATTEEISIFEIMGSLPDMAIVDTANSLKMTLIIFIIVVVILFS
ncbi:MAG: hypothetical protein IKF79_06225, partial [Methanosphaera sp.]|nr:hypothetical protein [Methanosphaera sp.]